MEDYSGCLAFCSRGMLGLITEPRAKVVTYPDGNTGAAYVGIQLSQEKFGEPWSSRDPRVIGHTRDLPAAFEALAKVRPPE